MRRFIFCAIGLCVSFMVGAQCVNIYGDVRDAYTGKPVAGVLINQKMKGKLQPLSRTSAMGQFQASLGCGAEGISLEAKGYRPQILPVNLIGQAESNGFQVPVKLVPIDKQASDQPYFQEQQQFVSLSNGLTNSVQRATRLFEVTDALTGKKVQAELCLFYTKSGKKDCQQLSGEQPGYEVDFTSTDIVAIEVKAKGYQDYFGNLIMDRLDNKKSKYQIRLSAQFSMLSLTVKGGDQKVECQLSGNRPVSMISTDGIHFSSEIPAVGNYQLVVKTKEGAILHSKSLAASSGMNLYAVNIQSARIAEKPARIPELPVTAIESTPRTIYFDKSDYKLREKSKIVLDSLASWLSQNPSGYLNMIGHTDNVGNSKLNLTLSEYRARLAYHFLEQRGADVSRVTYTGKGDAFPVAPNDSEANKEKNRRVEIQLWNKP
ncbi:OmpA family protein [Dyadobacter sp. CY323]|uniref:OmpA family protein n=1 Tax=Dyadobacter sp. CY323 TaxID=2907302 RepID=UPI001F486789|nr:OmpA family protein [Dyadobacter sp. CY323]MCE6991458.1 OmpA family protein [Dyadobacter sp. CY323]